MQPLWLTESNQDRDLIIDTWPASLLMPRPGVIVFASSTGRQMSVMVAPKTVVEDFPIAAVP